ncbi:MAG: type II toxin-antitoxin system RelE/ParE family toxin [Burkholderiales bacterium]
MTVVALAPRALSDLEKFRDFLRDIDPSSADSTVGLILAAVGVLEHHPLMGRSAEGGLRELVISRGKTGYLALYRYDEARDRVLVLSVRHQREAGYA